MGSAAGEMLQRREDGGVQIAKTVTASCPYLPSVS